MYTRLPIPANLTVTDELLFTELSPLGANRFISVVGLSVREEVVDDHANNREEENNESPDDFSGDGAVRLEDLNCGTSMSA